MQYKKKNRIGNILKGAGLILVTAAVLLLVYNLWDGHRARESEEAILAEYLQENKKASESPDASDKEDKQNIPDYLLNPDMDMPEYTLKSLGDVACIGILEIPALDLELPGYQQLELFFFKVGTLPLFRKRLQGGSGNRSA